MKALIVAAGRSSRLYPLTEDCPKGLIELGDERILGRSIRYLQTQGVTEILLVTGFLRHLFPPALGTAHTYLHNPFFAHNNNMASLWFARQQLDGQPFLYLHGDLLYSPVLLETLLAHPDGDIVLLTEQGECDEEAMKVRVDETGRFVESNKQIPLDESFGEWTGIARFSAEGSRQMFAKVDQLLEEGHLNDYDTLAFSRLAQEGVDVQVCPFQELPWIEIDFSEDLQHAKETILPQLP